MSKLFKVGSVILLFLLIGFVIGLNGYQIKGFMEDQEYSYFLGHYSHNRKYDSQLECQITEHQDCKSMMIENYIPVDPYTDKRSEK